MRRATSRSVTGAVGAVVIALAAMVAGPAALPDPAAAAPPPIRAGAVRMNHIQIMGAHNAYHQELRGTELALATRLDPTYPSWGAYSHAPVVDLLGQQHVRGLELDLLPDPQGGLYRNPLIRRLVGSPPLDDPAMAEPGTKVLHVPDLDYDSSCRTLVACLRQVKTWRDGHRSAMPIIIQLEPKQTDDRVEQAGGVVSPPWDTALLDNDDQDGIRSLYTSGHPNLEGRAVFTQGRPGDPDAAITMVNDPRGANQAVITDLVRRGYIVRTRSDEPLSTMLNEETSRVESALASGAQLVTTDFPVAGIAQRYGSTFVAQLPGGVVVRCNPITAPSGCRNERLQRRA